MDEYAALEAWQSVVGTARLEPMEKVHNEIWRVIGEDGREWVLKHLPEFAPGVGPVDEFRVLGYLQAAGIPVAAPIITDDGLIVHNADNLRPDKLDKQPTGTQAYSLIPLLPNDPELRESPELAHTIGAGIGRLDRVLADCPWEVVSFTDDPGPDTFGEDFAKMPEELRAIVTPFVDRLLAALVDLPIQRTHSDCNVGNVLVHNGVVTGYIDLDHLGMGPRIRDLSYYLISRLSEHLKGGDPDAMAAALRHYVAGYHSEHPLTERELAAVVPMMLTVGVGGAEWSLQGWVPNPAAYQRDLRTIEWVTQRYDELVSAAELE